MKKTLTINLSGIVFHIDEDAYEKLGNYLNAIRKNFSDSDGRDEIISDIESRIAEMLQEKIGPARQVVTIADIDQMINIMGRPEEFAGDGNQQEKRKEEAEQHFSRQHKRVFRDPDDRIFAGVCSGIASYFGFDPIWLRLAFAIAFFFFGTGLLLYIILWVVIPIAKTAAEKLEMRGEPVNINNIGKTIAEETEHLKKKVNELKDEINKKENRRRLSHAADRIGGFLSQIFVALFKAIGKIFATFLIIIGVILLVALLAALFGVNSIEIIDNGRQTSYSFQEFGNLIFNTPGQLRLALIAGSLLIGIPLIRLIYGGFRILFNIPHTNRVLRLTFNLLWTAGLILSVYVAILVITDFNVKASTTHKFPVIQPSQGIIYLKAKYDSANNYRDEENNSIILIRNPKWNIITFDQKKLTLGPPVMNIVPGETDSFELTVTNRARGGTQKDAMNRAKKIKYSLHQTDSVIEFDNSFEISAEDKWRAQDVELTLKVPKNKMIYLDKSMKDIIYDIKNASNTLDEDMVRRKWIMSDNELKCIDCDGLNAEEGEKGILPPPPPPPSAPGSEK